MLCQINPCNTDPQRCSDIRRWPTFDDIEVEDLELAPIDLAAQSFQGLRTKVFLPGRIPFRTELRDVRVWNALDRRGARRVVRQVHRRSACRCPALTASPLPQSILDSPPNQVEQPGLESA